MRQRAIAAIVTALRHVVTYPGLQAHDMTLIAVGFVTALISAVIVIRAFIAMALVLWRTGLNHAGAPGSPFPSARLPARSCGSAGPR